MATITVRDLPDHVHNALKTRATAHRRSMEAEVRAILTEATGTRPGNMIDAWLEAIKDVPPVELEFPSRASNRPDVDFS